jgi:preprotein translocase subunit SecG
MSEVLIVIHLLIVTALVVVVLLQKSEGGGLGIGGGTGGLMTTRGTANVLTRATAILAVIFFTTSLVLSILATANRQPRSILDQRPAGTAQPSAPSAPAPGMGGGVLDQLRPQAPQAPVSQ